MDEKDTLKLYRGIGLSDLSDEPDRRREWYYSLEPFNLLIMIENNTTDFNESGYYPYMICEAIELDTIDVFQDESLIFKFSPSAGKYRYIGFIGTDGDIVYKDERLKDYDGDIEDIWKQL